MATPIQSIVTRSQTLSTGFRSFFNFPALKKCRLAEVSDMPKLQQLMNNEVIETFRDHQQLQNVINSSVMPLVWENVNNDLVMFASFDTRPQIAALSHETWESYVRFHFGLDHLTNANTWFLTMIILDPRYTRKEYFQQLLRGVFLRHPKKQYFVVYVPPDTHPHYLFPVLKKFFKRHYPKDAKTPSSPKFYVCSREKYFPRCKVRRAMPADNDDLMEMLDARCPNLRTFYGDYVIAEIADKTDTKRHILVIEHKNRPVGMMCLNGDPDLSSMEALQGSELMNITCSNAIFIEMAAFVEGWDEYSGFDLLLGAFELFPMREYCIMGLTSDLRAYNYLRLFSKLAPALNKQVFQEVYVLQKDICYSTFSVRRLVHEDLASLSTFLLDLKTLTLEATTILDYPEVFILTVENRIIGLFVAEDLSYQDLGYLAANFNLQNVVGEYGLIKIAIICPAFSALWGLFVRQVCGFTDSCGFFYKLISGKHEDAIHNCSFLAMMRPIRPREACDLNSADFGLCYTSKQLTIRQKHDINLRIIIAGGGRTAWSFLETLIFNGNNWYTNLTLINPNGIDEGSCNPELFPYRGSHGAKHMKRIRLSVWVNVVFGKVTGVDQILKRVMIEDGKTLDYDVLYLFYGVQYEIPEKLLPASVVRPSNSIAVVNTEDDVEKSLLRMQEVISSDPNTARFIIYGLNMDSLSILRYYLEAGVRGEYFSVVTTTMDEFYGFDEFVQNFLVDQFKKLKIEIFHKMEIQDLILDEKNHLKACIFKSDALKISLKRDCSLFFYFERKVVTKETRKTILNSGLGFDGRLIVDLYGRACDANIYGAGPFTKFKRMYYAERFRHEWYNSEEIGATLAKELMGDLKRDDDHPEPGAKVKFHFLRRQHAPLIDYCKLPGNVLFLVIRPPGVRGSVSDGKDLVTTCGSPKNPRYFRVHLNDQNVIESLVCLTSQPICHEKYTKLYGKHESLLDNILNRYNDGKIQDFFAYFDQAWMSAIYHDRYYQVDQQNCDCAMQQNLDQIDQNLVNYLDHHKDELPMYATCVNHLLDQ